MPGYGAKNRRTGRGILLNTSAPECGRPVRMQMPDPIVMKEPGRSQEHQAQASLDHWALSMRTRGLPAYGGHHLDTERSLAQMPLDAPPFVTAATWALLWGLDDSVCWMTPHTLLGRAWIVDMVGVFYVASDRHGYHSFSPLTQPGYRTAGFAARSALAQAQYSEIWIEGALYATV